MKMSPPRRPTTLQIASGETWQAAHRKSTPNYAKPLSGLSSSTIVQWSSTMLDSYIANNINLLESCIRAAPFVYKVTTRGECEVLLLFLNYTGHYCSNINQTLSLWWSIDQSWPHWYPMDMAPQSYFSSQQGLGNQTTEPPTLAPWPSWEGLSWNCWPEKLTHMFHPSH